MSDTDQARPVGVPLTTSSATRTLGLAGAGMSLIAVCYGLARFAYGLFVPAFRDTFALDASRAGLIASAGYAAYCVGTVAATVATPRLGARAVAVAAGSLATAGTALIALAPTGAVLALGVTIAGSSTGLASPPLAHAIALRVTQVRRDRVQTIVNAGTGLGVMVSGPVALLAHDQWRAAWLVFAVLSAAVTVWVRFRVPDTSEDRPTATHTERGRSLPPGALRLFGAAAVVGAASSATWTFGQELLDTVGGHSQALSTTAWIILGACGLSGAAAAELTRRVGLRRAWTISMSAMCGATAALAAAPQQAAVAVGGSAAFGAVYIALTGILLIWSTRIYPTRAAIGVGITFLLIAVGQSAAAPLLGLVADRTSLTTAFWISAALALAGSAMLPPARLPTA
ncbi:putative MFS family arabinose efflux permease [Rhodococcus sp. OK519]|uniref:YbfB/YjiJ family MFS transporter n=1 Tax=Rhodococcus sp. OK519 TaxID=2135729 RepID=UPI000D3D6C58|nr:putative MFS family arabinose efflux permease [Rhodococcus sp. OK519]